MNEGYFVSRSELLSWLNETLGTSYVKVEECRNGVAFLALLSMLAEQGHVVPWHRVRTTATIEIDAVHNFKLLQDVLTKHGIEKTVEVDKLVKGNYQVNLELLQWMKQYCEGKGLYGTPPSIPTSTVSTANGTISRHGMMVAAGDRGKEGNAVSTPKRGPNPHALIASSTVTSSAAKPRSAVRSAQRAGGSFRVSPMRGIVAPSSHALYNEDLGSSSSKQSSVMEHEGITTGNGPLFGPTRSFSELTAQSRVAARTRSPMRIAQSNTQATNHSLSTHTRDRSDPISRENPEVGHVGLSSVNVNVHYNDLLDEGSRAGGHGKRGTSLATPIEHEEEAVLLTRMERDLYYDKLREIEMLISDLSRMQTKSVAQVVSDIQGILYKSPL